MSSKFSKMNVELMKSFEIFIHAHSTSVFAKFHWVIYKQFVYFNVFYFFKIIYIYSICILYAKNSLDNLISKNFGIHFFTKVQQLLYYPYYIHILYILYTYLVIYLYSVHVASTFSTCYSAKLIDRLFSPNLLQFLSLFFVDIRLKL